MPLPATISCLQPLATRRDGFDIFIGNNKNNAFFIIDIEQKLSLAINVILRNVNFQKSLTKNGVRATFNLMQYVNSNLQNAMDITVCVIRLNMVKCIMVFSYLVATSTQNLLCLIFAV